VDAERAAAPLGHAPLDARPVHREGERLDRVAGAQALAEREEGDADDGAGLERGGGVVGGDDVRRGVRLAVEQQADGGGEEVEVDQDPAGEGEWAAETSEVDGVVPLDPAGLARGVEEGGGDAERGEVEVGEGGGGAQRDEAQAVGGDDGGGGGHAPISAWS
jgi:hypothetical protein